MRAFALLLALGLIVRVRLRRSAPVLWTRSQQSLNRDGGPEIFAQANVDPLDWIEDAETERHRRGVRNGEHEGRRGAGRRRHVAQFNNLSPDSAAIPRRTLDQIDDSIDAVEFAAWIGDDDIWRRISSETSFTVPPRGAAPGNRRY